MNFVFTHIEINLPATARTFIDCHARASAFSFVNLPRIGVASLTMRAVVAAAEVRQEPCSVPPVRIVASRLSVIESRT
jgi:hypothetical protein